MFPMSEEKRIFRDMKLRNIKCSGDIAIDRELRWQRTEAENSGAG
jgi:hypothetical protein